MHAKRNTPGGDRLDLLVTLVEAWEAKRYLLELPGGDERLRFAGTPHPIPLPCGAREEIAAPVNLRSPESPDRIPSLDVFRLVIWTLK
jgi:hypothetical protein